MGSDIRLKNFRFWIGGGHKPTENLDRGLGRWCGYRCYQRETCCEVVAEGNWIASKFITLFFSRSLDAPI